MAKSLDLKNWSNLKKHQWLLPPNLPSWKKTIVAQMIKRIPGQRDLVWVLSSGTQAVNQVKAIGLTYDSLICSAHAVNEHLKIAKKDHWLLAIPTYHVGGLGILARGFLSKSHISTLDKWNPKIFVDVLIKKKITLTSLVPTQVADIVKFELRCPGALRAVVVGGGFLSPDLYQRARSLGWPLLPSYGLTECGSQVATASLGSLSRNQYPDLFLLSHVEVKTVSQHLWIKSKALCKYIARGSSDGVISLEDPLREGGWMATSDLAELHDKKLKPLGRSDDVVKILGELVSLNPLQENLNKFLVSHSLNIDFVVAAVTDWRAGHRLIFIAEGNFSLKSLEDKVKAFNRTVSGPERITQICWVKKLPRTELNKVKKAELLQLCGF